MAKTGKAPASLAAARVAGFKAVRSIPALSKRLGVTVEALKGQMAAFQTSDTVDCRNCADGTLCFDYIYPNGVHVVGYCRNGRCVTAQRQT